MGRVKHVPQTWEIPGVLQSKITIFSNISVCDGTVSREERLGELCLPSLKEASYPCARTSDVGTKGEGAELFSVGHSSRTRDKAQIETQGEKEEFKAFCRVKVVRHWHKLNREGTKSPSLEISSTQPGTALTCLL